MCELIPCSIGQGKPGHCLVVARMKLQLFWPWQRWMLSHDVEVLVEAAALVRERAAA